MNAPDFATALLRELQALNGGELVPQRVPLRHITDALRNITAKHRDDTQITKEEAQTILVYLDASDYEDPEVNASLLRTCPALHSALPKLRRLAE